MKLKNINTGIFSNIKNFTSAIYDSSKNVTKVYFNCISPEKLDRKSGLKVDKFSNLNFDNTGVVIMIGGEEKKNPFYPSTSIAQIILWALRKQKNIDNKIEVSLNLLPALEINKIDPNDFFTEEEQKDHILINLKIFGATEEEIKRIQFNQSVNNAKYVNLIKEMKENKYNNHPKLKNLIRAYNFKNSFYNDIIKCIPEGIKQKTTEITQSGKYVIIELYLIIENYLNNKKIKIGYAREKVYDEIFKNILDGKYEELKELSNEINPIKENTGEKYKSSDLFGVVYWNEKTDENARKLLSRYKSKKALKMTLISTPILISTILGGNILVNNYQKKLEEKLVSSSITKAVKNKQITILYESPNFRTKLKSEKEIINLINQIAKDVISTLIIQYEINDKDKQELVYKLLLSELPKFDIINYYDVTGINNGNRIVNFIDEFMAKNDTFLVANNINTVRYKHLKHLEKSFIETINYSSNIRNLLNMSEEQFNKIIEILSNKFVKKYDYILSNGKELEISFLGESYLTYNNTQNLLYYILPKLGNKDIICTSNNNKVILGTEVAYDYFWQTRIEIKEIFKIIRWDIIENTNLENFNFIKKLVISDYINNEEEIKNIINKKGTKFYIETIFLKKYKEIFKRKGIILKKDSTIKPKTKSVKKSNYNNKIPLGKKGKKGITLQKKSINYKLKNIQKNNYNHKKKI